jgi:hypothetical protein
MLPPYAVDPDAVLKGQASNVLWRSDIPNYARAHALFNKFKTTDHKAGSLEAIVQNLVKNWEKGRLIFERNLCHPEIELRGEPQGRSTSMGYRRLG